MRDDTEQLQGAILFIFMCLSTSSWCILHALQQDTSVTGEPPTHVFPMQAVRKWLIRIYALVMGVLVRIWEFLLRVCSSAERPLHFIKLQLRVPEGAV